MGVFERFAALCVLSSTAVGAQPRGTIDAGIGLSIERFATTPANIEEIERPAFDYRFGLAFKDNWATELLLTTTTRVFPSSVARVKAAEGRYGTQFYTIQGLVAHSSPTPIHALQRSVFRLTM